MSGQELEVDFVTVMIGDQLFGLPIGRVHDVFVPERLTRVPLAAPEVSGVLNLRGRIVTALDMRTVLGLPPREDGAPLMAVGIEAKGEAFGLLIDSVGEVTKLSMSEMEAAPANLDTRWARVADGVYRLDGRLLVILNVDQVLGTEQELAAA
ncbi:chemotaxis protein CheW [Agaricicola taiwanensis]|uniref:Chemotaxis protein CheW n=1 Tax=Agaricicola taiwanensis TaxID=591372 RepID=A0A8J2VRR6_9RHOB|nr:chemotaxis protein CheW [Agaricicola taiwanensis]GGE39524.1 chemotaxis protein CheW [Agaricicola taiwanensis]